MNLLIALILLVGQSVQPPVKHLQRGDNAICNGCSADNEFEHPERIFGRTSTPGCVSCFDDTAMYNGATFADWDKRQKSVDDGIAKCSKQSWSGSAPYWSSLGREWEEISCSTWKKIYPPATEPLDAAPTIRRECRYWLGGEQERFRAIWGECAKGLLYMGGVEERKIETCLDKKRIFLHSEDGKGHCFSLKALEGR